ncbi:50S ribosomal protein L38e [Aeropyrum pernix K1]|uniref:Large ribosomal subunit protein eL38 n=2 Tax=Aeropyrum pernix TaxID=56636 RepID=RL38_AERPE|nr:50S ribosomal protein L38e [Aeropyrum pernix]Q9YFR9.1 RecName: Full=Large ribosomal subunit protein eL38; AltName: Full=50S ribosomal protein L38E [Aeropyrum pernix K1]BAA79092.1 50S ribosomal protein L38e [Aeropyrum pernix K1]GBF09569.1 50S ribosomal protein L38E [Aeropyrum pernix]
MPVELKSFDEFVKVVERAVECRVKRGKDVVKIKARTKRYLYTLKVPPEKEAEVLEQVKAKCKNLVEL